MRARYGLGFGVGAIALACAGPTEDPTVTEDPTPEPIAERAVLAPAPKGVSRDATDAGPSGWPRYAWPKIAAERHPLAGVVDVEVTADGTAAWVLTATDVYRWTFGEEPKKVGPAKGAIALVASGFDDHAFAIVGGEKGSSVEVWTPSLERTVLFTTDGRLSHPVTAVAHWDASERLFFAHTADGGEPRILSLRDDGTRRYEVTSPSEEHTSLTEPTLLVDEESSDVSAPNLLTAASAVPLSFDPRLGSLLWADGSGAVHRYEYEYGNWFRDGKLGDLVAPDGLRISPNGWLSAVFEEGAAHLVDPKGREVAVVSPPGGAWSVCPTWTPNGRALVGATPEGVAVVPVDFPAAPIRWLVDDTVVEAGGLEVTDAHRGQMYMAYEDWGYGERTTPVFASLDGMLEVLHAGFEAVFLRNERERSIPALRAFAEALRDAGKARKVQRAADIATVTLELLDGKPVHPDAKAASAAEGPPSVLHPSPDGTDWGDFVPRGPYATGPELEQYFRAFKYMNLTSLKPDERASLSADPALVAALRSWVSVQDAFLQGSRDTGMFDSISTHPSWVRAECILEPQTRFFPLSWGLDSELFERLVAHDDKPECGVPYRGLPSGLDLLIGLGSPWAGQWFDPDEQPLFGKQLAMAHGEVAREFGKPLTLPGVVPGWWRIVQVLGREERVPEGVDEMRWRGRLAETALASWTSLRHTMVLVNATSSAEAGDGGDPIFETLSLEPPTHAVDPVPAAWNQLAAVLGELEQVAKGSGKDDRVVELIDEARQTAETFGDYATRQMAGEALSDEEYDKIAIYARTVEHPYVLLKTAAAGAESLSDPDPMSKIVDVHVWNDPDGGTKYWHAAVGDPRDVEVLIGDRGILLPAQGALYSYYEQVADHRLDDVEWRGILQDEHPSPPVFSPARQ